MSPPSTSSKSGKSRTSPKAQTKTVKKRSAKKTERRSPLSLPTRQKIKHYLDKGYSAPEIVKLMSKRGVKLHDVYNVKTGRVKTKPTPHAMKDVGKPHAHATKAEIEEYHKQGKTVRDMLAEQLASATAKLGEKTIQPEAHLTELKKVSSIQRHLEATSLEAYLKNPDSRLIGVMMRLVDPELTDDDIVKLHEQAKAIIMQERFEDD